MAEVNTSILFTTSGGTQLYPLDPEVIAEAFDPDAGDVTISFLGKANGFKLPRGRNPGIGYILLKRSDVDNLNLQSTSHKLTFVVQGSDSLIIDNLCIASALAITGTVNAEAGDVYLVELRDIRHILPLAAIDKSYNVPTIDLTDGTYYTLTKNAGSAWTWTTMLQDIYAILPITPSLILTDASFPAEVPENYCFRGIRAWDAFCQVVEDSQHYITCTKAGAIRLVPKGFADTNNRTKISTANTDYRSLNVSWPKFGSATVLPAKFRVFFPSHSYAFQNSTDNNEQNFTDWWRNRPTYSVDITTNTLTGMGSLTTISGTVGVIHSPRGAYYDTAGTILNSAALNTEATLLAQHAADQATGDVRRQDIFHGLVDISTGVAAAAVAWYDYGDGIRTELYTSPENTPSLGGSGGGSEDSPTDGLSIAAKDSAGPPDLSRWDLPFERFAVCKLLSALAPDTSVAARVEYGTEAAGVIAWTDTPLPHMLTVYESFGNYFSAGDIVYVGYHSQVHKWLVISAKSPQVVLVRFRLTSVLSNGGSANAVILTWNGAGYTVGAAITVVDWHTVRGMWQGVADMEGFGMLREGTVSDYDIIWMGTYGWDLEGTQSSAKSGSIIPTTVAEFFEQGHVALNAQSVHDDQTFFPRALSGAKVKAVRSEYKGTNPYYKALNVQQQVLFGGAVLAADLCGSATATITGFVGWTFSPFNQDPTVLPAVADNPFGLAGCAGNKVFVVWGNPTASWVIVQVTHSPQPVMQGLRINGLYIEGLFQTFYLMDCCTGSSWIPLIPLTTCLTPQYPPGNGNQTPGYPSPYLYPVYTKSAAYQGWFNAGGTLP